MKQFRQLYLLFIILFFLDLSLVFDIGQKAGFGNTVMWLFLSAVAGIYFIKQEGAKILFRFQSELAQGQIPTDHLIDGLLVFIGGVLLIIPGPISDVLGLTMVLPITRKIWRYFIKKKFKPNFVSPIRQNNREKAEIKVVELIDKGRE